MRQGPHHSAQKSMRTGTSDSTTSPWKFELVISTALATFDRPSFVISVLLPQKNEAAPGKTTEGPVAFPPAGWYPARRRTYLDDPHLAGVPRGLGAVRDAQLLEDVREVELDRLAGDGQALADLCVREA